MKLKKITAFAAAAAIAAALFPPAIYAAAAEISGVPVAGQYIEAEYDAADEKTVCRWYVDGKKVKTQYHTNDKKSAYLIKDEDEGKKVKYEITSENNNAESAELKIYDGDRADKIAKVIDAVEAAMGTGNSVGGNDEKLLCEAENCTILWDSSRSDIINSDGTVNLPLYDDGAVNAKVIMTADVDGITINKSYNIKTATQHYPVFVNYNAEDEEVGAASALYGGNLTVTDEEKHSGEKAYKRERDSVNTSSPHEVVRHSLRENATVPPSTVNSDTMFIARMYSKLPEGSAEKSGNGLVFISGAGGVPYTSKTSDEQMLRTDKWTLWEGISRYANWSVNMYIYGTMARNYLIDDFEIAKLCVGSIEISNDSDSYTVEIPEYGEAPVTQKYVYKVLNQYGGDFGMKYLVNGKGVVITDEQTARFGIKGKIPEGVEFDAETGVLTVTSAAKEGEIIITATSDRGEFPGNSWVTGEKKVALRAKGEMKPEVRNARAAGTVAEGAVLAASYDYYQAADEVEEDSVYQWLIAEGNKEENYKPIEGENKLEYTVKESDIGKLLCCEITPRMSDGTVGTPVRTNVVAAETAPQILDSSIIEPEFIETGASIGLKYTFYDVNYDNEAETEYTWQRSDSKDGVFEDIPGTHSVRSGAENEKIEYTFTDDDTDKYIRIKIMPKSDARPFSPQEPYYGEAIYGPARPTATEVGISGSAKAGSVLTGTYKFAHPHSYGESGSVYAWYADGTKVGTESVYAVQPADEGKRIYFEVTPKSSVAPSEGLPIKSAAVTVAGKSSSGISVGGGGGSKSGGSKGGSVYGGGAAAISQTVPKPQYKNPFTDITNHWAYNDIVKMAELGIAKGTDENTFSPEAGITRAEFITLALRVLNEDSREYKKIFDDVSEDKWYAGYMTAAAELKIISDKAERAYPESLITRQEMAKIAVEAYKASGRETGDTAAIGFADSASINEWAKEYVNTAAQLGIIKGEPNGNFNPSAGATRAEALTVIKRLYELLES